MNRSTTPATLAPDGQSAPPGAIDASRAAMNPQWRFVLNTYRFLRVGMVVVIVLLVTSIVLESTNGQGLQPSISDFYFTAVHSVFVAALCSLGVCLVAYHGSSDVEDSLLNISGFLAFIVAFVPVSRNGPPELADAYRGLAATDTPAAVSNNVAAVFLAAAVVVAFRLWLLSRQPLAGVPGTTPAPTAGTQPHLRSSESSTGLLSKLLIVTLSRFTKRGVDWFGYLIFTIGIAVFMWGRGLFLQRAHGIAAPAMFGAMVLVMLINAYTVRIDPEDRKFAALYRLIAAALVVLLFVTWAAHEMWHGGQLVFWLELSVVACFTVFWGIQTYELRDAIDLQDLNAKAT